ncbi:MAG: ABC transporter substrate-binding protein [Paucibacter sp.]|nr:ABC transporter substrate-binding protein [Roseateles sp.]
MNKLLPLLLALSTLGAHAVSVKDDAGRSYDGRAPQRVVSLLPSLTESVCALGACKRLVGVDRYSNFPASVKTLPSLGGLDDVNVEAVVALKPDVVLAAPSSRVAERLGALGIPVFTMDAKSYTDVRRVLLKLGELLDLPNAGKLWDDLEKGVAAAAQSMPARATGVTVYYEIASGPYAAGPTSYMGELLDRLGARNIIPATMGPFPKISPEFVVRADPRVILISERESVGLAQRPGWNHIEAIKRGNICLFTPEQGDVLARPGPRMPKAAQLMADCLTLKSR